MRMKISKYFAGLILLFIALSFIDLFFRSCRKVDSVDTLMHLKVDDIYNIEIHHENPPSVVLIEGRDSISIFLSHLQNSEVHDPNKYYGVFQFSNLKITMMNKDTLCSEVVLIKRWDENKSDSLIHVYFNDLIRYRGLTILPLRSDSLSVYFLK